METLLPQAYGFILLLMRTAGLTISLPGIGAKVVPMRLRLAFALAITFPIFVSAGRPSPALPTTMLPLSGAMFTETLIGLSAGFACQLAIYAVIGAGQLASTVMGLSYGHVLDHIHGAQSNAVSEILSQLAICGAMAAGLHREAIAWLCRQAVEVPPGSATHLSSLALVMITHSINSATLGYRLAFPFLAAVNVGHLAFGLLGKTAQQINLHSLGFSVTILLGGVALYFAVPTAAEYAAQAAIATFTRS